LRQAWIQRENSEFETLWAAEEPIRRGAFEMLFDAAGRESGPWFNLMTDVRRGENRGRTLKDSAVVRRLTTVGALKAQQHTFSTTASVPWAPGWNSANVRVISFLQERQNRRVVGAGSGTIGESTGRR
jgi:hypothetical protein